MQRLDELQTIVSRDTPERVFQAVLSGTAEGDTVAQRVISALPMRERREVAGAVLQRLGRATPGQQNAAGDAFSSETFLTNLARMSEPARKTLLGRTDLNGLLDKIGQLASVADVRREGGRIITAAAPLSDDDLTRIINNRTLPERARVHALSERARRRRAAT